MAVDRMNRVNSQLARELSRLVSQELKDKDATRGIITSVDCSRDLKHAKVYFTTLEQTGRKATREALQKTAGFLRSRLGQLLSLRTVPELQFKFDASEEEARRMDQLLDSLVHPGESDQ